MDTDNDITAQSHAAALLERMQTNTKSSDPVSRIAGFGPNTHVLTPEGELPVEWLATGDRLITRDHGAQPILWMGRVRLTRERLEGTPETQPISIAEGALGPGFPAHPTWLAHRTKVLLSGSEVALHAGTDEALSEIGYLRKPGQIEDTPECDGIFYTQILLPMHEVVSANGLWAETLQLDDTVREVLEGDISPALLADPDIAAGHRHSIRMCLDPWEVMAMRGPASEDHAAALIRRVA